MQEVSCVSGSKIRGRRNSFSCQKGGGFLLSGRSQTRIPKPMTLHLAPMFLHRAWGLWGFDGLVCSRITLHKADVRLVCGTRIKLILGETTLKDRRLNKYELRSTTVPPKLLYDV